MIRLHYHVLRKSHEIGSITLSRGTRCCHVYSTEGVEELLAWGEAHGMPATWIHKAGMPHFDCWGSRLAHDCQAGLWQEVVGDRAYVADLRTWRSKRSVALAV